MEDEYRSGPFPFLPFFSLLYIGKKRGWCATKQNKANNSHLLSPSPPPPSAFGFKSNHALEGNQAVPMLLSLIALVSLLLQLSAANVCEPTFFSRENRTIPRSKYTYPFTTAFLTNASTEVFAVRYSPDFSKLVYATSDGIFVYGPVPSAASAADADWERPLRCAWNSPGYFAGCDILRCRFAISDDSMFLAAGRPWNRGMDSSRNALVMELDSCAIRWEMRNATVDPSIDVNFIRRGTQQPANKTNSDLLLAIVVYRSARGQMPCVLTIRSVATGAVVAETEFQLGYRQGGNSLNIRSVPGNCKRSCSRCCTAFKMICSTPQQNGKKSSRLILALDVMIFSTDCVQGIGAYSLWEEGPTSVLSASGRTALIVCAASQFSPTSSSTTHCSKFIPRESLFRWGTFSSASRVPTLNSVSFARCASGQHFLRDSATSSVSSPQMAPPFSSPRLRTDRLYSKRATCRPGSSTTLILRTRRSFSGAFFWSRDISLSLAHWLAFKHP